jgi:hypothetical protein
VVKTGIVDPCGRPPGELFREVPSFSPNTRPGVVETRVSGASATPTEKPILTGIEVRAAFGES